MKSLHLNENTSNKLNIKKKLFNNSYSFHNEKHKKYFDNDENMIKLSKTIKNLYDENQIEAYNVNDGNNKSKCVNKTPVNSYKRRLKLIKNRLMKTKNSIFAKKRMFQIKNGKKIEPNHTLNRNNQSFVDNVRSKFNSLKRNGNNNDNRQSKKFKLN